MNDNIEALTETFARFPGIGPRQARRMVYFVLRQNRQWIETMAKDMLDLKKHVAVCQRCYRHFIPRGTRQHCPICDDASRSSETLLVVEKDIDLDAIEKSGVHTGLYFVLGGSITALEKNPESKIKGDALLRRVQEEGASGTLKEIILALSATPDGDDTAYYLASRILPLLPGLGLRLSTFGRGLSTGSELEYADKETIKNAYRNRQ